MLHCYPLDGHHFYTDGKETAFKVKTVTKAMVGDPVGVNFDPLTGTEVPPSVFWSAIERTAFPQNETAYNRDKAARESIWGSR